MYKLLLTTILFIYYLYSFGQNANNLSLQLKKEIREKVIEGCHHGWDGYKQYAWRSDELSPLSKKPKNWYRHSMLMTPVDAYDTFVLLGMKEEVAEAKKTDT